MVADVAGYDDALVFDPTSGYGLGIVIAIPALLCLCAVLLALRHAILRAERRRAAARLQARHSWTTLLLTYRFVGKLKARVAERKAREELAKARAAGARGQPAAVAAPSGTRGRAAEELRRQRLPDARQDAKRKASSARAGRRRVAAVSSRRRRRRRRTVTTGFATTFAAKLEDGRTRPADAPPLRPEFLRGDPRGCEQRRLRRRPRRCRRRRPTMRRRRRGSASQACSRLPAQTLPAPITSNRVREARAGVAVVVGAPTEQVPAAPSTTLGDLPECTDVVQAESPPLDGRRPSPLAQCGEAHVPGPTRRATSLGSGGSQGIALEDVGERARDEAGRPLGGGVRRAVAGRRRARAAPPSLPPRSS